MSATPDVSAHYTSGHLLERLRAALVADGVDPDHPTIAARSRSKRWPLV